MKDRIGGELSRLIGLEPLVTIHAEKMSDHLKEELPGLKLAWHSPEQRSEHWDWYTFEPVAGAMYMACLANCMASHRGMPLVSDNPLYQRLIRGAQDEASRWVRDGEDKGYLPGSAVIEAAIPEDLDAITAEEIVSFRKRYDDERHRFYNAVAALAKEIPNIQDPVSLQDCVEHHTKTIEQAVTDLRSSLTGLGITCGAGFMGLSVPAWAHQLADSVPQYGIRVAAGGVLTLACGILAKEGFNYYRSKKNSPYSYILSIKKQLRRKFFGRMNEGLNLL